MAEHVKNQHYVPKFLLEKFSEDESGTIWCYDKIQRKVKQIGCTNIANEKYFYDQTRGKKEGSYEYKLASVETEVAPIIDKVVSSKTINLLSFEERVLLSLFTVLQMNRTRGALTESEYFIDELMGPINELASYHNIDNANPDPRRLWFSMLDETPAFASILAKKLWFLIEADNMFYTSDNPIVRYNLKEIDSVRGTLGLNSDGIEIYFPLSPSIILCMLCERTYAPIIGFNLPPCLPENIEFLNSLQVLNASRFIFSRYNDFELAIDMTK